MVCFAGTQYSSESASWCFYNPFMWNVGFNRKMNQFYWKKNLLVTSMPSKGACLRALPVHLAENSTKAKVSSITYVHVYTDSISTFKRSALLALALTHTIILGTGRNRCRACFYWLYYQNHFSPFVGCHPLTCFSCDSEYFDLIFRTFSGSQWTEKRWWGAKSDEWDRFR